MRDTKSIQVHLTITPNGLCRSVRYDMNKTADIARYVAQHAYAWPGGYPLFAITDDGGTLCKNCCRSEYRTIRDADPGDGWLVVAPDVNYEHTLYCDHCGDRIESAYPVTD